jgi:thiol-disulfide isomerase/thioredoxin
VMLKTGIVLAMWLLAMGLASGAGAQSTASAGTSSAAVQPQNGQLQTDVSPDVQPTSLGDLARQVRAHKQTDSKTTEVIDDESLPTGGQGISIVGSSVSGRKNSFAGSEASAGRSSGTGRMTLLDFWASWCGPCRESVPDLKALQRAYGTDQLKVVSVDEDKNEDVGHKYASEHGMNWEVQFDSIGATAQRHNVHAFPTFILVDGNGREVQRFVGVDPSRPLASRVGPYLEHARKTSL